MTPDQFTAMRADLMILEAVAMHLTDSIRDLRERMEQPAPRAEPSGAGRLPQFYGMTEDQGSPPC